MKQTNAQASGFEEGASKKGLQRRGFKEAVV
jgi:hypothetical protein